MDFAAIKWPHHGMDSKEIVGQRVDIWLEATDRTAAEVCDELGIGEPKFSQWRNGRHMLSLDIAVALCTNYGLTLDWLYRGIPVNLPYELRLQINDVAKRRAARLKA
jgi:transcriptional regulator with XRE-family HTH domain